MRRSSRLGPRGRGRGQGSRQTSNTAAEARWGGGGRNGLAGQVLAAQRRGLAGGCSAPTTIGGANNRGAGTVRYVSRLARCALARAADTARVPALLPPNVAPSRSGGRDVARALCRPLSPSLHGRPRRPRQARRGAASARVGRGAGVAAGVAAAALLHRCRRRRSSGRGVRARACLLLLRAWAPARCDCRPALTAAPKGASTTAGGAPPGKAMLNKPGENHTHQTHQTHIHHTPAPTPPRPRPSATAHHHGAHPRNPAPGGLVICPPSAGTTAGLPER
jgi:hypothetical protein